MRILAFANRDSAPAYHRIMLPLALMPTDVTVYVTNNLTEELFDDPWDIVMYNRIIPIKAFSRLLELRTIHGFKIVIDVDDHWILDSHHIMYENYKKEKFASLQILQLKSVDAVFTTHYRLQKAVEPYNNNVYSLPNAIPKWGQFNAIKQAESDKVRLFWQGSITHFEDLNIIGWAIANLVKTDVNGKFGMVMGGYHEDEPVWKRMANVFTAGGHIPHLLFPGTHHNDYYQIYQHADICLVPLLNTRFNSMKSNLKVLEAANLGLPVICNEVNPYKEMDGVLYAKGTSGWMTAMRRLIHSAKRREDLGQQLKEFCDTHFNFYKINKERLQVLETIKG